MNTTRSCAYCRQPLKGKANQVYCSNPCKKAAFNQKAALAPPLDASAPVASPLRPAHQALPPPDARGAKDARQTLRLQQEEHQHLERLKQMDHAERERERTHQLSHLEQGRIAEQRELIGINQHGLAH